MLKQKSNNIESTTDIQNIDHNLGKSGRKHYCNSDISMVMVKGVCVVLKSILLKN